MRLLTLLAVATLAAGVYHYRQRVARPRRDRRTARDRFLVESVRSAIAGTASSRVEVRCLNGVVSLRGTVRRRDLVRSDPVSRDTEEP
jgi:osmotically-inducible protein OsmY